MIGYLDPCPICGSPWAVEDEPNGLLREYDIEVTCLICQMRY